MFRALIRSRMSALMFSFFASMKGKKNRGLGTKILIGILAVYIIWAFAFMFGGYFSALCVPLVESGLGWLYFAFAGIVGFALAFIGSVFTAQKQLFDANDNDLLLSMPIPPGYILGSRMLMLLALNYVFEILVVAPAGVVYCMEYSPSVRGVVVFVLCAALLPLLALTFSCLLGWLLMLVTSRVRSKSLISVVFSLVFLGAYFAVFYNMNNYLTDMVVNSAAIGQAIHSSVYPAWAFGAAIAEGSLTALLAWIAICVVPLAAVYYVLMRSFIKVATTKHGAAKIKYQEKEMRVRGQSTALLWRELKHFLSNSMYVLNAALGSFMTIAAAVAMVIYKNTILLFGAQLPMLELSTLFVAGLCLLGTTEMVSAPSVSLEGRTIWLIRSLPVSSAKVLLAKVKTHLVVSLPPIVLAGLAAIYVLSPEPLTALILILAPASMCLFSAFLGVCINLHFPKLDFINEVAVVKQSMSVIITMFGTMGLVAALGVLYAFVLRGLVPDAVILLIYSAAFLLASLIMYRWLTTKGARMFETLG